MEPIGKCEEEACLKNTSTDEQSSCLGNTAHNLTIHVKTEELDDDTSPMGFAQSHNSAEKERNTKACINQGCVVNTIAEQLTRQQRKDVARTEDSQPNKCNAKRHRSQSQTDEKVNTGETGDKVTEERESLVDEIIHGTCTFDALPPLPKKVVRIFISSTFTDTKEERNAFMQNVYPKLSDYCRSKYGLDFQVADMRWGVPEQASDNHSTTDLCIQEIKKCKEVSFGPNFVALVGDKYGYRPIPSTITERLFDLLEECSQTSGANKNHWSTVKDWYLKDENCIPPLYVLQPISHKIADYNNTENVELRKVAQAKWYDVNDILTSSLREAANIAFESTKITKDEWEPFFISVTENEINNGLTTAEQGRHECCSIIRKIEGIDSHLSDVKTPRFLDVTTSRNVDKEAQNLLQQLKVDKIQKCLPPSSLIKVDIEWHISGANVAMETVKETGDLKLDGESRQQRHDKYVEGLCNTFFDNIKSMIDAASEHRTRNENPLVTEVAQHWHLASKRCDIFEGRQDLLHSIEKYITDSLTKGPAIIYGCSGCGKTSIMSKILQCLSSGTIKAIHSGTPIIIPRFLGTTPATSNVHQLLVSVCCQLSTALGIKWSEPEKFQQLVQCLNELVQCVPSDKSVILLMDSIDQLMPAYGAFKLKWIPETLPSNVKFIVSSIKEGYPVLNAFTSRFGNDSCFEVATLSNKTCLDIICKWLSEENKKITTVQIEVISQALKKCTLPLYIRITYDEIRKWKSYEIPPQDQLQTTVQGAIDRLFQSMEDKFGLLIVKHAFGYLTAARHGLSEAEMEHILSLDDVLLNDVFRLWDPPVRRVPPLLWTRLRTEIQSYIVERSADDTLVLAWYHRQFIEAVKEKYLKDASFAMHITKHLVEYFSGMWGGGKEKPFHYTEAQAKRFMLKSTKSAKDRKAPQQPYIFKDTEDTVSVKIRYNQRKLSELPFHLIKTKNYKDLKRLTFFNFEWILAKLKSQSVLQILEEFDLFMQADKVLKDDQEMKLLCANLSLIRPFIQRYPDSLAYELIGRLAKCTGQSDALTDLIRGCDEIDSNCPVIPLFTCFETADVGFKQNIKFRDTEPWVQGGAITCTADFKVLYILQYHDENQPVLLTYDINTGEQVGFVSITKPEPDAIDMYSSIKLSQDGEKMYACCRQMAETVARKNADKFGIVYVIDIATGMVVKTIEEFLHSKNFADPIRYMRQDVLCLDFCVKVPLVDVISGSQKVYSKPSLLNHDGELVIVCDKDKTVLRKYEEKQDIAQFDTVESQMGVFGTEDFGLVILIGSSSKQLRFYDASSKCVQSDKTYSIKAKKVIDMTDATMLRTLELTLQAHTKGISERGGFIDNHVDVKVAPNRKSFMVIYSGWKWVAYLYSLNISTWSIKYVGNVTKEEMSLDQHYPDYTCNSKVIHTKGNTIFVLSSETLNIDQEFQLSSDVRSMCISKQTPKVLVMLKKNVLILNIDQKQEEGGSNQTENNDQKAQCVIVDRNAVNNVAQNEISLRTVDGKLVLETIEDLVRYVDTDRISTARSKRATALMKFITPNGLRVIHFHAKVQVIDIRQDRVEYTPKKGDVLVRVVNTGSVPATDIIEIPGLQSGGSRSVQMTLQNGDRITNEYNKVKYRINQCDAGQYKIMNVPSQLSIYTVEGLKLRRLHTLSVYQESVLTVGNKMIVTSKETKLANFINIYDQDSGKLTATHELPATASHAQFSTDEAQLFVADTSLTLSIYEAPDFNALEQKASLQHFQDERYEVTKIHTFDIRRSSALVQYSQGLSGKQCCYRFVDVTAKVKSEVMELKLPFEDISEDGKYAVDSKLNLYDLTSGKVKLQLADSSDDPRICARITSDNKCVVFVNRNDDTLHVVEVSNAVASEVFCCFCHSEDINVANGIVLLNNGMLILLNTKVGMKCLVFKRRPCTLGHTNALSHTNEWSRSVSLSKTWFESHKEASASSYYDQRELIKKQIDDELNRERKPEETEFNRDNVAKPQVLIMCEPILSTHLRPGQFSQHLITDVVAVASAVVASEKLQKLQKKYDAILLQLITEDVKMGDSKSVIDTVCRVVEQSKLLTKITLLSLVPSRVDDQQLNTKMMDVNNALLKKYANTPKVYICKNENLCDNGKPVSKFFHVGVILSEIGVKQMLVNLKEIILPPIAKHAPDIQTSGNKQLYMFWSKFLQK